MITVILAMSLLTQLEQCRFFYYIYFVPPQIALLSFRVGEKSVVHLIIFTKSRNDLKTQFMTVFSIVIQIN